MSQLVLSNGTSCLKLRVGRFITRKQKQMWLKKRRLKMRVKKWKKWKKTKLKKNEKKNQIKKNETKKSVTVSRTVFTGWTKEYCKQYRLAYKYCHEADLSSRFQKIIEINYRIIQMLNIC